jgi:transcription antitermination factor NusG
VSLSGLKDIAAAGEERVTRDWYAVYTKFQHEKSAASLLEKKDFEVFLPVYRTVHRWKDRNQLVILPLFPCYLFLRTDLDRKLEILRTAGVRWIVENAGRACPVPEAELEAVRRISSVATRFQPHPFLSHGDLVRVRKGPLIGMEGFFVRAKNQFRVVVSVDLLRKSVAVEVDLADVELMNSDARTLRPAMFVTRQTA